MQKIKLDTSNIRKIIGSVTLVAVLAYFVCVSNRLSIIESTPKQAITSQEREVVIAKPEPLQLDAEVVTIGPDVEPVEINYLSVEEAFEATEQQALELLEDYKFHLSQDTAESHFGIFRIKSSCMGINFYTQQDLDGWIAEDKWARGREAMRFEAIELMMRVGRCHKLVSFIGTEEIGDAELLYSSLKRSAELGHPIGKLLLGKNTDPTNMTVLFTDAYEFSKVFPRFKAEVYGMALRYIKSDHYYEDNTTYLALSYMVLRDGIIFNEFVDPNQVVSDIQDAMEIDLRPLELDAVHRKRKEITEAMENGDWSWLLSES
ncbi:MAG: hypothetical protein P8I13_01230 [Porticoccaceae bacterium]|nr:hypothetical protein [Porticoccaceae bacterium]